MAITASLNSTARLEYTIALDGISNTQTINPNGLGKDDDTRINNLRNVLDGYFDKRWLPLKRKRIYKRIIIRCTSTSRKISKLNYPCNLDMP